ncbi:hypothetical protein GDO86_004043 [Hymenochirus boettgeri]|uniref:Uncharacterized protein n=1 Tax=Hymenochirus boettgeri TaxID=247094 RepID=A0A8T2K6C9_9PIPI|nr:hypothetical protein GDO86_004043 [Hymenochirus boettgeri]
MKTTAMWSPVPGVCQTQRLLRRQTEGDRTLECQSHLLYLRSETKQGKPVKVKRLLPPLTLEAGGISRMEINKCQVPDMYPCFQVRQILFPALTEWARL